MQVLYNDSLQRIEYTPVTLPKGQEIHRMPQEVHIVFLPYYQISYFKMKGMAFSICFLFEGNSDILWVIICLKSVDRVVGLFAIS